MSAPRLEWLGVIAAACLSACATPRDPHMRAEHESARGNRDDSIETVVFEVRLPDRGVDRYGDDIEHALSPNEQRLLAALGSRGRHVAALSRMTRALARHAPDRTNVPPALVDGLMAWAGLVDPPPRLVVVELGSLDNPCADTTETDDVDTAPASAAKDASNRNADGDANAVANAEVSACQEPIDALAREVERSWPAGSESPFGLGIATGPNGKVRMMVAIVERGVELEPFPRAWGAKQTITLRGRLLGERKSPAVEVVDPRGTWRRAVTKVARGGRFSASVGCEGKTGTQQVEVLAEGTHGPEVVANFPIACGEATGDTLSVIMERLGPDVTPQQIAKANFDLLNHERERRGLRALSWNAAAGKVALEHSTDMQRNGFVGHRSPRTGDVADRFERAGIPSAHLRENVARGYGPKGIHDSLMSSPGHRVNMLSDDVTEVGIGVVLGEPESSIEHAPRPVFLTQNFLRSPDAGLPEGADPNEVLVEEIDAWRVAQRLSAIPWDAGLVALAKAQARILARGGSSQPIAQEDLRRTGFASVERVVVESGDFQSLVGLDLWHEPKPRPLGVAVARIRSGRAHAYVLVALIGNR